MNKSRRVAVIGSGVSGAVAAWLMRDVADVQLFEASPRFGGHTHTACIEDEWGRVAVDTGFMVFNRPNYPLLSSMFEHLGVATYPTSMSFSASFGEGRFEYAGSDLNGLFGQRRNLLSPTFWGLLRNILKFNAIAQKTRLDDLSTSFPLDAFLDEAGLSRAFREHYLYPMAAAIWSCPWGEIGRFPAVTFLRFFRNHGLIQLNDRPQWHTVEGGASTYMQRLIDDLGERAHSGVAVRAVTRSASGIDVILADGRVAQFDEVVLACHSDQALRLLDDSTPLQRSVLGAIPYQENRVLLHRDAAMMPRRRRVWASWNYLAEPIDDPARAVSVTYWMNSLQRLATRNNYFVSLNPWREPASDTVVAEYVYEHPVFSLGALSAQRQLHRIQGTDGLWFAGAWTGYGFHEDGMRSGVEVARALGAEIPWESQIDVSRDLTLVPDIVRKAA